MEAGIGHFLVLIDGDTTTLDFEMLSISSVANQYGSMKK
jgi:hypothetical protein